MTRSRVVLALLAVLGVCAISGDARAVHSPPERFFGVDVPNADPSAFAAFAERLGVTPTVSAIFIKLDSTTALDTLRALPADVTPFVTLEPWSVSDRWGTSDLAPYSLRALAAGVHDAALLAIAHVLADLHRTVYLRFAHEMNGSWYPWAQAVNGNRPGDYIAAWRHVHDLMAPITGPSVRWVWSPNILSGVKPDAPSLAQLYPGDAYVDDVGLTGYGTGKSVPQTFCPTLEALRALTAKPIVISETGTTGARQLAWLAALGPFLAAQPDVLGVVYFNTSPATTGASGNYRLTSRHQFAALRTSVRSLTGALLGTRAQSGGSCPH